MKTRCVRFEVEIVVNTQIISSVAQCHVVWLVVPVCVEVQHVFIFKVASVLWLHVH
jgi:hypothetical protein